MEQAHPANVVGVVVVGHGTSASALLGAARSILPQGLEDAIAVDAAEGRTPEFEMRLSAAIDRADAGRGVCLLVDLPHASPCQSSESYRSKHEIAIVAGMNLAMLLKIGAMDRVGANPTALTAACVASGRRAVATVGGGDHDT